MTKAEESAKTDGFADGIENTVWRADRHPVECRRAYEMGFKEGQATRSNLALETQHLTESYYLDA